MRVRVRANPFVPEMHLFHDRRKFLRFCRREYGVTDDLGTTAQMTYGHGSCAVLFDTTGLERDLASDFAMLAHEAYHVAVARLEELGEDRYGEETVAYLVQVISGSLCSAHIDWMGSHGRGARMD